MKFTIKTILLLFVVSLTSCVFNINSDDDDCLRCHYKTDNREVSEELCSPTYTQSDKDNMRDRMQEDADDLNVTLHCETH